MQLAKILLSLSLASTVAFASGPYNPPRPNPPKGKSAKAKKKSKDKTDNSGMDRPMATDAKPVQKN